MQGCAYVEGEYVAPEEATVSMFDWGFLHSDATYDVAHVWEGSFFKLDAHLDRFFASMARLRLDPGISRDEVRVVAHELVRRSGLRSAYVEFLCTRGIPEPGSRDPRTCRNRFMAFAIPFVWIADPAAQDRGVDLHISDLVRIPPRSVDPTVKNYHWLDMVMGLFQAYDLGRQTAVLVDEEGTIAEGPGFNVFAVNGNTITTPAAGVLRGVTRQTVLDLIAESLPGHAAVEGRLSVEALRTADEVFLTSTGGGVIPIATVDGIPIGGRPAGAPGPVTTLLRDAYWEAHKHPRFSEPVVY